MENLVNFNKFNEGLKDSFKKLFNKKPEKWKYIDFDDIEVGDRIRTAVGFSSYPQIGIVSSIYKIAEGNKGRYLWADVYTESGKFINSFTASASYCEFEIDTEYEPKSIPTKLGFESNEKMGNPFGYRKSKKTFVGTERRDIDMPKTTMQSYKDKTLYVVSILTKEAVERFKEKHPGKPVSINYVGYHYAPQSYDKAKELKNKIESEGFYKGEQVESVTMTEKDSGMGRNFQNDDIFI